MIKGKKRTLVSDWRTNTFIQELRVQFFLLQFFFRAMLLLPFPWLNTEDALIVPQEESAFVHLYKNCRKKWVKQVLWILIYLDSYPCMWNKSCPIIIVYSTHTIIMGKTSWPFCIFGFCIRIRFLMSIGNKLFCIVSKEGTPCSA